jgi:3-dehydroquinate synthase
VKILEIHGSTGNATIVIGESFQNLTKYIPSEKAAIITDKNVRRLYSDDFPHYKVIEIGTGEGIKNLDTVRMIYEKLVEIEADRSCFIVGIGGGIVCDITGFVASTFLRGVRFGFVPTTLLSQVDAGVGGKNGVNFSGYKNMVGVFHQPECVLCDMNLLRSLSEREISSGLAEIVKHAAIADPDLFTYLEEHYRKALALETEVVERFVYDSLLIKSSIVNRDEKETGERRKLNFGHTFGHAIEKSTGLSHGEAVSVGMVIASALSAQRGLLPEKDKQRIVGLLENLMLPTGVRVERKALLDAIRRDKKRKGEGIFFVLLHGIGNAVVVEIPMKELEAVVHQISD